MEEAPCLVIPVGGERLSVSDFINNPQIDLDDEFKLILKKRQNIFSQFNMKTVIKIREPFSQARNGIAKDKDRDYIEISLYQLSFLTTKMMDYPEVQMFLGGVFKETPAIQIDGKFWGVKASCGVQGGPIGISATKLKAGKIPNSHPSAYAV